MKKGGFRGRWYQVKSHGHDHHGEANWEECEFKFSTRPFNVPLPTWKSEDTINKFLIDMYSRKSICITLTLKPLKKWQRGSSECLSPHCKTRAHTHTRTYMCIYISIMYTLVYNKMFIYEGSEKIPYLKTSCEFRPKKDNKKKAHMNK